MKKNTTIEMSGFIVTITISLIVIATCITAMVHAVKLIIQLITSGFYN